MAKGVMFGLLIVFLTITLVSLIAIQKSLVLHHRERLSINIRIKDMNNMYDSIVRDVDKSLDIIAKRAILVCVNRVITEGEGLENANLNIKELIINGTLNGTSEALMTDSTLPDWINKMEQVGDLKGYYLNLIFEDFEVKPYDSFNLIINSKLRINITDKKGIASIVRDVEIENPVSFEGFDDPLYALNSLGRAVNTITKTPYEGNYTKLLVMGVGDNGWAHGLSVVIPSSNMTAIQGVQDKNTKILVTDNALSIDLSILDDFKGIVSDGGINESVTRTYVANTINGTSAIPDNVKILVDGTKNKVWYMENFREHVENSYYQSSEEGASFLDRLEGELDLQEKYSSQTNNTIGLESFVDKDYLLSLGLGIKYDQTNIDYLYFSDATISGSMVKTMDEKFKTDTPHQETYGVSDILLGV